MNKRLNEIQNFFFELKDTPELWYEKTPPEKVAIELAIYIAKFVYRTSSIFPPALARNIIAQKLAKQTEQETLNLAIEVAKTIRADRARKENTFCFHNGYWIHLNT